MKKVNEKLLEKYCRLVIDSAKPMVKLTLTDKLNNSDIALRSQFSGSPYWPRSRLDFWNSLVNQYGNLSLLVQLNLSEVKDKRLPQSGLLQVFMVGNSYCVFEDDPSESDSVKGNSRSHIVVYHEGDSLESYENVHSLILKDKQAHKITAQPGISVVNMSDTSTVNEMFKKYDINEDDVDSIYDFSDEKSLRKILKTGIQSQELKSLVEQALGLMVNDKPSSRVDGYPHFSQDDERTEGSQMKELLVQLSSDDNIMFGDLGDVQVFTSMDELKSLNPDEIITSYYIYQCY